VKLRISVQINILIAIFISFTLFFVLNTYIKQYQVLYDYAHEFLKLNIEQTVDSVTDFFYQIREIIFSIQYNILVQDYLTEDNHIKKYQLHEWMKYTVGNYSYLRKEIFDVGFLTDNKIIYFMSDSGSILRKIKNSHVLDNEDSFTFGVLMNSDINKENSYIYFCAPIYSQKFSYIQKIGMLVILFESKIMNKYISAFKVSNGTKIYLLNDDNLVIASTEPKEVFKEFRYKNINKFAYDKVMADNIQYITYASEIDQWNLFIMVPSNDLYGNIKRTKAADIILMIISFILIYIISYTIKQNINNPVNRIFSELEDIRKGNLNYRLSKIKNNELGILADQINSMLDEIQRLNDEELKNRYRLYKMEIEKKQAELMFLNSQINPHFLYNVLESINSIASYYNAYEIEQISTSLAELFRSSIKEDNCITISKELEILNNYITIQKIRFSNKFDINMHADPGVMNCLIPKLTLQPLVENAIVHGVTQKIRMGQIWLEIRDVTDNISIYIKDNGAGIPRDVLNEIQDIIDQKKHKDLISTSTSKSTGIINVFMKLKLQFGNIKFKIDSKIGEYTEINILLPKKLEV